MSNNNKIYKILAKAAVVSASIAAGFAIFNKFKKNNNPNIDSNDNTDDNFDMFNFSEIGKDSPREYVSININERIPKENIDDNCNEQ